MNTDQILSGLNASTGIRDDDSNAEHAELLHSWTSSGTGILVSPRDIAELKVRSKFGLDRTFSPEDVDDQEFYTRRGLNDAWRYEGGRNGQRQETPVCLNPNDGFPDSDCEWLVGIANPDGSVARQQVGRYGVLRLIPNVTDRRGQLHTLELTKVNSVNARTGEVYTNFYLNGSPTTAHNIEGFVAGFKHAQDLSEFFASLRESASALRSLARKLERQQTAEDTSDFRDKPPTDCGY